MAAYIPLFSVFLVLNGLCFLIGALMVSIGAVGEAWEHGTSYRKAWVSQWHWIQPNVFDRHGAPLAIVDEWEAST